MRKKWFRQLLRRRIFVILLLVLQGLVLYALIRDTSQLEKWISTALSIISLLVALRVISSRDKPSYKLLWVALTGDCHGNFRKLGRRYFPGQETMDREDCMIICGDFGGVWADTPEERYWLDWLEQRPFTTIFVDGNHENFARLNALPVHSWHGGAVHCVRPHVLHLMRGQLYEIGGRTFFTMGGARSHDIEDGILDPAAPDFRDRQRALKHAGRKRFRVLGQSWWPEEMPSDTEYLTALETLEKAGWKTDYVITHCAPTHIALAMSRHNTADALSDFLEMVERRLEYTAWFFGHFHDNRIAAGKHILLWEQIIQVL